MEFNQPYLKTKSLYLVCCDTNLLENALVSNKQLAAYLQVSVPDQWTAYGKKGLIYALEQLKLNKNEHGWWTYFAVHIIDKKLIGSCGYKGQPDKNKVVEIGYEIKPDYRNRGLATELVEALVKNAFANPEVHTIQAHTLGQNNASTKVLAKCGFKKISHIDNQENGLIWKWALVRP